MVINIIVISRIYSNIFMRISIE